MAEVPQCTSERYAAGYRPTAALAVALELMPVGWAVPSRYVSLADIARDLIVVAMPGAVLSPLPGEVDGVPRREVPRHGSRDRCRGPARLLRCASRHDPSVTSAGRGRAMASLVPA